MEIVDFNNEICDGNMKKILITGGKGNFATKISHFAQKMNYSVLNPYKNEMDIRDYSNIDNYFNRFHPNFDYVIHAAALTTPMAQHKKEIKLSIETNIIGTGNVVIACEKFNKKIIYISTNYVYPGNEGNYDEDSNLKPFNEYAWSKLGGECSVHLYHNSLILRICMNRKPFPHPRALVDVKSSFIYNDDAARITLKLIDEIGIINIGGKEQSIYEFVKEQNPSIGKIKRMEVKDVEMGINSSINISKMKSLL